MQSRFPNRVLPYVFLAPSLLIALTFFVVPSAQTLLLSFYRVSPLQDKRIFIGLDNIIRLLKDPEYLNSIAISFKFALLVVPIGLSISLGLAIVGSRRRKIFNVYRALLIWPYALSPASVGLIWALMMEPNFGLVTTLLKISNSINFNFRTNGTHALLLLSAACAWKMLGYNFIFFLAGLHSIPSVLREAASIDGANRWTQFWRITFPLLSPTIFFLIIMNTLYAFFEVFGLVDVTTGGGPGRATDLLIFRLYRDGFIGLDTGFASAQSMLLLIMVLILTFFQFRYVGNRVFYQ